MTRPVAGQRLPRPLRLGLAAAVVTTLATVTAVAAVGWTHPRDEAAFLGLVHGSVVEDGVLPFDSVSDDALLAEGDRACEWLAGQAPALWRRGEAWTMTGRIARYQDDVPAAPGAWDLGHESPQSYRGTVVSAAWAELCGGTRTLHRSHGPFGRPAHD